nr:DEAD/DEAH box helicase [Paenibacillus forsythiae]
MQQNVRMIVIFFTLRDIRDLCGETFYKRGMSYYKARCVNKLTFHENENSYTAQVRGSRSYQVQINIDNEGDIEADCTCPAYEDYGCCKHVAATLIAINMLEQKGSTGGKHPGSAQSALFSAAPAQAPATGSKLVQVKPVPKPSYQQADQFISLFNGTTGDKGKDISMISAGREQLQFEFIIKVQNTPSSKGLSLEMRVGVKRLYVVSKIKQFLECMEHRTPMYFTSQFTFDLEKQHMNDADIEFLNVLVLMKNTEKIYKRTGVGYYSYPGTPDGKAMVISPLAWDKLKPLFSKVNAILEGAGHPGARVELLNESPPLSFSIGKGGTEGYALTVSGLDKLLLLPDHSCLISEGRIYNQDAANIDRMAQLQQNFSASKRMDLSPLHMEPFVQRVLPALRLMGTVKVKKEVKEKIVEPELQAKIFLDYEDSELTARVEFHYDSILINPLNKVQSFIENNNMILVRNLQLEDRIIAVMDQSSMSRKEELWTAGSESEIYETLYELIPLLEDSTAIFLSQAAQNLVQERKPYPKVSADLSEGLDWLNISFELEGLDEKEIVRVMQAIVEKKKYIRLRSGAFLSLEEERFNDFRTVAGHLNIGKKDLRAATIRLPSVHALKLPEREKSSKNLKWGKSLRLFLEQLKEPENMDFELPVHMVSVLRDYQVRGFQWMKTLSRFRFGGILADDMGLGKTIQTIAYICSELGEISDQSQILIICPASLTYNWANEFARFAPEVRVLVAAGQKAERSELLEGIEEADVVITSYPLLRRDIELYSGKTFHALILDEAQAIKNVASQTAQTVKSITAARKFALTGTPIENSLDELGAIFSVVFPLLFSSRKSFKELPVERISAIVSPFILRRLKKEVLEELPDRIETVQRTELLDEQKKLYLAYLSKLREETEQNLQAEGFQKSRMKILAGITRLRQICCHPALFIENYEGGSGKLEQLLETVKECHASGKRLLVFSQFSSMLKLIRQSLEAAGILPFYLDGATPAAERVEMCRHFNEGEGDVFLISLKAGGTGLNLTGADTVILYDLWWNPAVEEQAIGRAHRMGQRSVVQVIRMVTEGSIEEKILELQQRKKDLIEEVIEAGEDSVTRLSEQDIREMLRM